MSIWLCMPGGFVFEEILCGATSVNHLSLDPVDVMYCLSLSPVKPGRSSAQFSPDLFICRKFMENWSKHLELVKTPAEFLRASLCLNFFVISEALPTLASQERKCSLYMVILLEELKGESFSLLSV